MAVDPPREHPLAHTSLAQQQNREVLVCDLGRQEHRFRRSS